METVSISEATKEMQTAVKTLYEKIHKVLTVHTKLNRHAMCACQSLGYNGFKRWHRYRSCCFFDLDTELANELFDKFRIKADFKDYELSYNPENLEMHLKSWEKALLDGIQELGTVAKSFYEQTVTRSCVIEKAMCKMSKDHRKVCRLLSRFTESEWLTLDMHIVDDKLHKKYKCKEEGSGEKWIHGTMQMKY